MGLASASSPGWTSARPRATGGWRKDFPNLPAWIVKAVGGSTTHWAGASLRFQEHEFKTLSTYGKLEGANLLDWPITLAEMEPYYAKAEDKMGVTRTNGMAAAARQQQLQGAEGRRRQARLQGMPHRPHGDQFGRARRPHVLPADRLLLPGLQMGRQMVDALHRDPQGRGHRPSRSPAERHGAQDQPRRLRQGDRRRLCRQGRQAAGAEGAHRRRRRQFDREPAPAAQFRVEPIPGRARQFVGAGRQELHAPHHRLGLCHLRQAGAHVSRHHHGRHHPRRGAPRSVARLRRRLRVGDAVARPAVHGRLPRSRAAGAAPSPPRSTTTTTWPACGSSARTCRSEKNRITLHKRR